jgi:hypothetical protein
MHRDRWGAPLLGAMVYVGLSGPGARLVSKRRYRGRRVARMCGRRVYAPCEANCERSRAPRIPNVRVTRGALRSTVPASTGFPVGGRAVAQTFEMDRVDRIADILYGVASGNGLIYYVPLGRRLGIQPNHLGQFLDQVSRRAIERGEPMWSALVVSSETGQPSSGFYVLVKKLRAEYSVLSEQDIWQQERDRCYEAAQP